VWYNSAGSDNLEQAKNTANFKKRVTTKLNNIKKQLKKKQLFLFLEEQENAEKQNIHRSDGNNRGDSDNLRNFAACQQGV
jgi:hypothetical protein